jgi:hypothetical protein
MISKELNYKELRDKKLVIRPLIPKGGWLKKGHDGEHSYTGTKKSFQAMMGSNGYIKDPLAFMTEDEKNKFAAEIRVKPEELSVFQKDNIFTRHTVHLDKNYTTVDCKDPMQFMDYLILRDYPNLVRIPGGQERQSQMFEIIDELEKENINAQKISKKVKANIEFGKLDGNKTKMRNILLVAGKTNIPSLATEDWLMGEVYKIMENSPNDFLAILEDPMFDMKIFVNDAMNIKAITQTGKDKYELTHNGTELGNLKQTINYFEDIKNQDDKAIVLAQIQKAKGK